MIRNLAGVLLLVGLAALPYRAAASVTPPADAFQKIDTLLAEGRLARAEDLLASLQEAAGPSARLSWRQAQAEYEKGQKIEGQEGERLHYRRAEDLARRTIELAPDCAQGYKWLAIALGALADDADTETQIELSRAVRRNIDKALELNPDDDISHLVLSRWHYKVSSLGFFARALIRIVYGGMPGASLEKAEEALWTAITLRDRISHRYYLAKVYNRMGRRQQAVLQLQFALDLPVTFPEERETRQKAMEKLEKWQ